MIDRTDLQKASDSHGCGKVAFSRQIWGKVTGLDSRCHQGQNNGIFRFFFENGFWYRKVRKVIFAPSCFCCKARRIMYYMTCVWSVKLTLTLSWRGGGGLRSPTLRFFLSHRQTAGSSELKLSDFIGTCISHILNKNITGQVRSGHQKRSRDPTFVEVWNRAKAKAFFWLVLDFQKFGSEIVPKTCISQFMISVTWGQVTLMISPLCQWGNIEIVPIRRLRISSTQLFQDHVLFSMILNMMTQVQVLNRDPAKGHLRLPKVTISCL